MIKMKVFSLLASMSAGMLCAAFISKQPAGTPDEFLSFLFAAYTITWIVFFGYLVLLARKQRDLTSEIEMLKKSFTERGDQTREH